VTSNRFRPPAVLAEITTTVDVVSGGRLDFGIGAGSRPGHPLITPSVRDRAGARPA
jgi:alkanesulfonate monooxygenase SsuD/methylene tetrahydromethanopterin reductase-like flavin-dependent oxidoreductase (luciferase family)